MSPEDLQGSHSHILYGSRLSDERLPLLMEKVTALTNTLQRPPTLHAILVGENPASHLYVSMKAKRAAQVGIKADVSYMDHTLDEETLIAKIHALNHDPHTDGILIQLPLPPHMDKGRVVSAIHPAKDVDGLTPHNLGLLMQDRGGLAPCTPLGCMDLIRLWRQDITGLRAVVMGRSTLVGMPLALLLTRANATVTLCHSYTENVAHLARQADILVSACGVAHHVTPDYIKPGACVIDVGASKNAAGIVTGDVCFKDVAPLAGAITPVPFGVGPMTVYHLLQNTVKATVQAIESNDF